MLGLRYLVENKGQLGLYFFYPVRYNGYVMKNETKSAMVAEIISTYGTKVDRANLVAVAAKYGISHAFLTGNKIGRGVYDISSFASMAQSLSPVPVVTDEEILNSQRRRFRALSRMAEGVIAGNVRSVVVSGPAGIGKTYTVETMLESAKEEGKIDYTAVRGFMKATGLFKLLWENKEENNVILLDDCDSAFQDEISLNLLKAALDTSKRRFLSWRSEKNFESESGDNIPNEFEFRGSVIFITNLDFEKSIVQGSKLAPHMAALISRSFYVDLNMSSRETMLRIKDVLDSTDMAYTLGLSKKQTTFLMEFIQKNFPRMREVSLRMVTKLAKILAFSATNEDFLDVAEVTCLKIR